MDNRWSYAHYDRYRIDNQLDRKLGDYKMKNCYKLFDGWEASFDETWSDFDANSLGDLLTYCVIRKPHTNKIYAGCAVLNMQDNLDRPKGKKVAFGRALDAMISYNVCETPYDKSVFRVLRRKFWDAFIPQL